MFAIVSWSALAFLVGSFLWGSAKGFDLSDESYHLLSYRFPNAAPPNVSQFQYVVNALTLGRPLSVAGYRTLGLVVLIAAALALTLGFVTFTRRRLPEVYAALPATSSLCAFAAVASLLGLSWLPRTISYLSLAPALAEFATAAVLFAASDPPGKSWRPKPGQVALVVTAGFMLTLLLFVKFPAAALVGMLLAAFLVVSLGLRRGSGLLGLMVVAAIGATLLLTKEFFGGPFSLDGLRSGASAASQGTHSASFILTQYLRNVRTTSFVSVRSVLLGVMFAAPVLAVLISKRRRRVLGWALSIPGPLALVIALRSAQLRDIYRSQRIVYMLLGGVALGLVLAVGASWLAARRRLVPPDSPTNESNGPTNTKVLASVIVLIMAMPFATSFGTNIELFLMTLNCGAAFAIVIALAWSWRGKLLPASVRQTVLSYAPMGFVVLIFAFVVINGTVLHSSGLDRTVFSQTQPVTGVDGLADVSVDPKTARVLTDVQTQVKTFSRVKPGDPVMVGERLGGLAYAMDLWIPGSEWVDNQLGTCLLIEKVPDDLARTDVVIRSTKSEPGLEQCLNRVMPGYPNEFDVKATVPGFDDDQLEVLVRRPR